jgi:hypothetical protein
MIKPYRFKMSEIEGFRYRVSDAYKNVSALSIKEARLKEIRAELLSSQKLKDHFDDNPRDLQVLRHDRVLLPHKVKDHLKYIPPYLRKLSCDSHVICHHSHTYLYISIGAIWITIYAEMTCVYELLEASHSLLLIMYLVGILSN